MRGVMLTFMADVIPHGRPSAVHFLFGNVHRKLQDEPALAGPPFKIFEH